MKIVFNRSNFINLGLFGDNSDRLKNLPEGEFLIFDYPPGVSRSRYKEFSVFNDRLVYLRKSRFTRWLVKRKSRFNYVIDPVSNMDCIPIPSDYQGIPPVPDPENWIYIDNAEYVDLRHAVLNAELDAYKVHLRSVLTFMTRRYFRRTLDSETLKVSRLQKMGLLTEDILNEYLQLCNTRDIIRLRHSYIVNNLSNMSSSEQIDSYLKYYRNIISINWRGNWSEGVEYRFGNIVDYEGKQYRSKSNHTSSEDNHPGTDTWEYLLDIPSFE